AGSGDTAKVYVRGDAQATNASLYVCSQTGVGTFGWELAQGGKGSALVTTTGLGHLWIPQPLSSDTAGTAFPALAPRFYHFTNPSASLRVTTLSGYVQNADGGTVMTMGIYDSSCNLIEQTNTVSLSTVGNLQWTFSPVITLGPGVYYLAIATDSTSSVVQ